MTKTDPQNAEALRAEIERAERELSNARDRLDRLERSCPHRWSATTYDPIITQAYTIPGDPPGTMGIDWRGPTYVPSETKDRWKRVCERCKKVEYTASVTERVTKEPKW